MKKYSIGDFLTRIKNSIELVDNSIYKRVTIKANHQGVHLRDKEIGAKIGTKKQFIINGGDFILSKIDARYGAFGIIPPELDGAIITGNFWTYEVDNNLVDTEWFFYFTHSYNFIEICKESSTGTTHRKYLDETTFLSHPIDLPSIEEQKMMVKRFKVSSKLSDSCFDEILIQKQLINKFKQSILQEAIQGKLTEDWRKQNPNVVPASKLLARIKTEKAKLIKEKKIKKEKPLPQITDEEVPFELPEGWVWCRLEDICSKTGSGSTPKGGKAAYPSSGIKFLRSQNVYDDGLRYDGMAFIYEKTHEKMKGTQVKAEDLLLNITGGSIGRCCIVPKDFDTGNINQHVAIVRTVQPSLGYYLHHVICSPYFQNMIIELQTGAGREGLPKNKMDNILIALPPQKEQEVINEKIYKLRIQLASLAQEIDESEQNAQMLMQAVLKEAFESRKEVVV